MDVDASLKIVGLGGCVQNTNFVIFGMGFALAAIQLTSVALTVDQSVEHYCKPAPGFMANETTPIIVKDGRLVPDSCQMYEVLNETLTENTTTCQHGWEYPAFEKYGETSFVTDVNLVCSRGYLAGLLISIHFAGVLVGGFLTGQAGDTFGRRPVCMATLLLISVLGTAVSFTWNLELMMALRFLLGVVIPGNTLTGYILVVEMFTPKKRLVGHVLIQHFWSFGVMLVAPLAYLMPNWRRFQLVTSLMCLPVVLIMCFFTYESLRWLIQKGQLDRAEAILQRIAKSKNIQHDGPFLVNQESKELLDKLEPEQKKDCEDCSGPSVQGRQTHDEAVDDEREGHCIQPSSAGEDAMGQIAKTSGPTNVKRYTVLDLFKTRVLIKHTSIVFVCWFVMNATYFGFILYSTSLSGNRYLSFFLLALVEAPVYGIDFFIVRRFGRKRPDIVFFFTGAVACLLIAFFSMKTASGLDSSALVVAVAMIGKFYTNAAYEVTLLMSAEIFPTVLRNIATGSSSTIGRISAIMAPFIVYLVSDSALGITLNDAMARGHGQAVVLNIANESSGRKERTV
ncbi:organic cation transporter protein-like [Acanthaster planci]|uniref:Organic cation transporter protein-like n=1 Tax=Acanthaster planci TaxID=133434 RepID=A0A8B7ZRV1_ACAPL|nr:organic cation transporter protein-like [Acanthaster planci]XP_022107605.1 organic cation transporter protein-like [Acanthaster planci]XP_022107607.1 organic cation transporter protein-like [Acanthaster planci]